MAQAGVVCVDSKPCTSCGQILPKTSFNKARNGLTPRCKGCLAQVKRDNPQYNVSRNARRRARRKNDPTYRETVLKYEREYRASNPEQVRGIWERFRSNHPDYYKGRGTQRNARARLDNARRRARKQSNSIKYTVQQLSERFAVFGYKCWMCGDEWDHIDHVKPIAAGGIDSLANIRPACSKCNLGKGARWYGPRRLSSFKKERSFG